jgi:D-aminoacyl-tRNA deacylase
MKHILFTSKQTASNNIAKFLIETEFSEAGPNTWKKDDFLLVDCLTATVLDIVPPADAEFALVLSPHRSETKKPCLTAHTSGNWCPKAEMGGDPSKLSISNPSLMRSLLLNMNAINSSIGLGFDVCYEADHHGPTLDVPYTFVEVGSSEEQWNNLKACKAVADSVLDSIKKEEKAKAFFGIGFSHYMPSMTRYVLNGADSAGHLLPSYAFDCLDERMFIQGIERNRGGRASYVALEKKAFNSAQKAKVKGLCETHNIELVQI